MPEQLSNITVRWPLSAARQNRQALDEMQRKAAQQVPQTQQELWPETCLRCGGLGEFECCDDGCDRCDLAGVIECRRCGGTGEV